MYHMKSTTQRAKTIAPKVLLFDIETAPNLGYVWAKYQQNVIEYHQEWYILSVAWKWLGEKTTHVKGLLDMGNNLYTKKGDDKALTELIANLFNEADVVVAHNGDGFDIKKVNAKILENGLPIPSFYKSVDTLKVARKYFKFNSNKLDDLGNILKVGRKQEHQGFKLWLGCLEGDEKSWKKMKAYNKQDVVLLEQVYLKLRPWIENHPNLNLITGSMGACPKCTSTNVIKRGFGYTKVSMYQKYQCLDCGGWSSGERITSATLR